MKPLVIACALGGITLLATLVLTSSPAAIVSIISGSALPLASASAYRVVPLSLYAISWRLLIAPASRPRSSMLLRLRWIGESVNALLPVAQIGGDVARARLLAQQGAPGPIAAASTNGRRSGHGRGEPGCLHRYRRRLVAFSLHGSLRRRSRAAL